MGKKKMERSSYSMSTVPISGVELVDPGIFPTARGFLRAKDRPRVFSWPLVLNPCPKKALDHLQTQYKKFPGITPQNKQGDPGKNRFSWEGRIVPNWMILKVLQTKTSCDFFQLNSSNVQGGGSQLDFGIQLHSMELAGICWGFPEV